MRKIFTTENGADFIFEGSEKSAEKVLNLLYHGVYKTDKDLRVPKNGLLRK